MPSSTNSRNTSTICQYKKMPIRPTKHYILGTRFSHHGVAADHTKIQVMLNWPIPNSLKELHDFLVLTGYYQRYVAHYGTIAWPLTELLKKDNFKWGPKANSTFHTLKTAMANIPILALPNFSKPFVLETNASWYSIGTVFLQNEQPIASFSQSLPPTAIIKFVYERELMVVVWAIRKWRHYLLGHKFIACIDQHSLKFLLL